MHKALFIAFGLLLLTPAVRGQTLGATNLVEGSPAGSDSVVLAANGAWTATTNAPWLHLSAANQSGAVSTNVIFSFDANSGATRAGTLTIAGLTLIVTQAGSTYVPATNASTLTAFLSPGGVAVDGAGNVYISQDMGNAIREWRIASNTVTTLVSPGSGLNEPGSLAVDGAGNVYIADIQNNAIKEWIAASNTVITLVSSNSITPLTYPGGVAVDGAGNVYIADRGDNAVKEWMPANNTVTTLVSTDYPFGVAVDGSGNVYISSLSGVFKWTAASNTVTPLPAEFYQSWLAVDAAGNLYLSSEFGATYELPHAFLDPTAKMETALAGNDVLPAVVPATANLTGPFAPVSDSAWLTVTGVTNDVVSLAFTANQSATNRTGHITELGQKIAVTQAAVPQPVLTGFAILGNSAFQFGFTNLQGASFTVWTSTNLSLPLTNWTALGSPTNLGSGQYEFTDLAATNGGQRFYRVSSP